VTKIPTLKILTLKKITPVASEGGLYNK